MNRLLFLAAWLLASASFAIAADQLARAIAPRTFVIPDGNLRLKGYLWTPPGSGPFPAVLFCHGSGTDAQHTSGLVITAAAEKLAPVFVQHGYAFLYLFRRGQGLSADQGPFMQDLLQREEAARGKKARNDLHYSLLTTDHLDDVTAGLMFLKHNSGIDASRIAVAGHSFGGQLTLLAAERDSSVRAAITFGAAAGSWEGSPRVRQRLVTAVRATKARVMLLHAANDYSVAPGRVLSDELARAGKPYALKIYPPVGRTPDDGHNFVYSNLDLWERDVFGFLDRYVGR